MSSADLAARYPCADYLASEWSARGFWDEEAQLWVSVPLAEVREDAARSFLVVGRPGVDEIDFGYRR